ncbi:MAG: hypothetical protein GY749_10930 [Desulfobacteraceae bacterium]|nr:hypothetical protein [Desulfobacteraceae bacterium]
MEDKYKQSGVTDDNDRQTREQDLELLVAYAENRLENEQERAVRDRLAKEPALRNALSGLVINTRGTEYEKILHENSDKGGWGISKNWLASFWIRIVSDAEVLKRASASVTKKQKLYLIPIFAVVTCMIVFMLIPVLQTSEPELLIIESYKTAMTHKISMDHYRFPWEKPDASYGFASPMIYSHASLAFGAGLWSGRQVLSGRDSDPMPVFLSSEHGKNKVADWSETPWNIYFRMGEWGFLIQAVCVSDKQLPYTFWKKQGIILEQMQKHFTEKQKQAGEDSKVVTTVLRRIKAVLDDSKQNCPDKKQCRKIAFELGHLIKYLSPKCIPKK